MQEIGKLILFLGLALAVVGALLWRFPNAFGWLGHLPGDLTVQKENFSFSFPIVTCVVISLVLSLLAWLIQR